MIYRATLDRTRLPWRFALGVLVAMALSLAFDGFGACGGNGEPGKPREPSAQARDGATAVPVSGAHLPLDRHALEGSTQTEAPDVNELRAALGVLIIIGETDPHPFREILSELASVGTDDAAALALEDYADQRMLFEGKDAAFAEVFRALLGSKAVKTERPALQTELARIEASH